MDKTFNFFKSKAKKENERPRNHSKSNSSKASHTRKAPTPTPPALTRKERDIREAIQQRYQRSKLRNYRFSRTDRTQRSASSSHSSQMEEYRPLQRLTLVDLNDYHRQRDSLFSNTSSQDKKHFNPKFKFRDPTAPALRTEGNDSTSKHMLSNKGVRHVTPPKLTKKAEEWRYISIQLKDDPSRPKPKKQEPKIHSHRTILNNEKQPKLKTNSSTHKNLDKAPKSKDPARLKTKF